MRALVGALLVSACAPMPTPTPADGGCRPGTLAFDGTVLNARDLGGTPTADGQVACGAIFRGAVPSSGAACGAFATRGVKTVIDLRVPSERQGVPDATCLPGAMVLAPMPIPSEVSPANYLADLDATTSVRAVFTQLGDEGAYPVFFHCTYGRDRSGVLAALVLSSLGVSRQDVLTEYQLSTQAGLSTTPASLEAVLDELDRRGGVEAHLRSIGVSEPELATLRARGLQLPQP